MREVPFGLDGDFSHSALINRINSDLANDLGNLLSRSTAMLGKYFQGVLPAPAEENELDEKFTLRFKLAFNAFDAQMDDLAFNKALQSVWELISAANKYIDETAPWTLAKDESQQERLGTIMYNLIEGLRVIALLITPFMPHSGKSILKTLAVESIERPLAAGIDWGVLEPGTKVEKAPPLFPRIAPE